LAIHSNRASSSSLTPAIAAQVFRTAASFPSPVAARRHRCLNDLYIRFFRIAERRFVGDAEAKGNPNGRGLVSFISDNAWLDGLSHVSMRARYLAEFQRRAATKVWEYTLGGYQVLKKWLSYREEPLLGRPLHEDEARYFSQVVRRIAAILLMGPALDASYAAILPTARGLVA